MGLIVILAIVGGSGAIAYLFGKNDDNDTS